MKTLRTVALIGFVLLLSGLSACKDDDTPSVPQEVSGVIELTDPGSHQIMIDADEVKASVLIVGAGGGGGGGVVYENVTNSTGGGGGGGAGESIFIASSDLKGGVTYTINIAAGGQGGVPGNDGQKPGLTTIDLGQVALHAAKAGNGGRSNSKGESVGGAAGSGFPGGAKGTDGEMSDNSWSADAGKGGLGGDNQSGQGSGGTGGNGASLKNKVPTDATNGGKGGNGYVKIEWTGVK